MKDFFRKNRRSIYGGIVATVFTGLGVFLLGNLSGNEAQQLISSSLSGINMLCNTIILASATILALLLTLLALSSGSRSKLKSEHYLQVLSIAKFVTILFIGALVLFQFFNIPVTEAESIPTYWFTYIYWAILFFSSLLSGMMITAILMLYSTVSNMIHIVGLGKDHFLVHSEEEESDNEEQ